MWLCRLLLLLLRLLLLLLLLLLLVLLLGCCVLSACPAALHASDHLLTGYHIILLSGGFYFVFVMELYSEFIFAKRYNSGCKYWDREGKKHKFYPRLYSLAFLCLPWSHKQSRSRHVLETMRLCSLHYYIPSASRSRNVRQLHKDTRIPIHPIRHIIHPQHFKHATP